MKSTDNRRLFDTLIGASAATGNIATIPATQGTAGDGTASIALAFPPETFIARAAGGEPPRGADMNGFLNLLSGAVQVLQAGYFGPFDATFAAGIGGYPAGAIVAGSAAGAFWVSTADANTTVPGATGAKWKSLFDGYATQAWATGQFVSSTLFSDTNNIGAAYLGYRTDLGYAWMNYKNSAGAYAPVVLADRTWVNGSFATLSGLASEATARSNADLTLAQAIQNESTARLNADNLKANLAGGNSFSGPQAVAGDISVAGGHVVSIANSAGAGSMYSWPEYYASGNLAGLNAVIHLRNSSGVAMSWVALRGSDGSVWTSGGGQLAYVSQLPVPVTTTSGTVGAAGSYTIIRVPDSSTASGYRYRIMGQTAEFDSESRQTISLPITLSGIFPGAWGVTTFWPSNSSSTANDQMAQVTATPTTSSIVVNMNQTGSGTFTWPVYATWWIEGY